MNNAVPSARFAVSCRIFPDTFTPCCDSTGSGSANSSGDAESQTDLQAWHYDVHDATELLSSQVGPLDVVAFRTGALVVARVSLDDWPVNGRYYWDPVLSGSADLPWSAPIRIARTFLTSYGLGRLSGSLAQFAGSIQARPVYRRIDRSISPAVI